MKLKNLYPQYFSYDDWINLFNIHEDSHGNMFFNLYNSVQIGDEEANPIFYTEHIATDADNLYHLSQKYYGTISLWWMIGYTNNIRNPFKISGKTLKIFKPDTVSTILGEIIKL